MAAKIISCTVPDKLVAAIDRKVGRTLDSRAAWVRSAIIEKAQREGMLRRDVHPDDAVELERAVG